MQSLQIISDFNTLAIPLDMIARKNQVSTGHAYNVLVQASLIGE